MVGITVLPVRLTRVAPAGAFTSAARPTCAILPAFTTMVALSIGAPPRLAEPAYLDRVGEATRRLEQSLGPSAGSPFAEAMKQGMAAAEELAHDVQSGYKLPLNDPQLS